MDKPINVFETVELLPEQVKEAWVESRKVQLPDSYKNFKRVLVCGMGGSALGGRVVHFFAEDHAKASIDVSTNYDLPAYADNETLVIVSSYSGNTEETVSCLNQAVEKSLPVFVISAGGKLAEIAAEKSLPIYKIDPQFNPSGQPRLAVGYSVGAIFAVLAKAGVLDVSDGHINDIVNYLKANQQKLRTEADNMAKAIQGKVPVLVASEHLLGASHVFRNQLNESAKSFSTLLDLPELNHHSMEGLKNPKSSTESLLFVFFNSGLYHERVQLRYPITKEVVEKNNVSTLEYKLEAPSRLLQVFELMQLGSYIQAFLGELYGEDPIAIPWVDYFKAKLA